MILNIIIKSRNVLDKLHWAVKSRLQKEYMLLIRSHMVKHKIKHAKKNERYCLEIISYRKRLLDYDNLVGGCKQLLDALTKEKYIYDDAPKYIDLKISQRLNSESIYKKLHNKTWITRHIV